MNNSSMDRLPLWNQLEANLQETKSLHQDILKTLSKTNDIRATSTVDDIHLSKRYMPLIDIIDDTLSVGPSSTNKRLKTSLDPILLFKDPSFSDLPHKLSTQKFASSTKINRKIMKRTGGMRNGTNSKWCYKEKELFYEGLKFFGTDFAKISSILEKTKTPKQVLAFFAIEDETNQFYVDRALLNYRFLHGQNQFKIDQLTTNTTGLFNLSVEQYLSCNKTSATQQTVRAPPSLDEILEDTAVISRANLPETHY